MIIKHKGNDLSGLVEKSTWSGSRLQVARKLIFEYVFDPRDPNVPQYVMNLGETVQGFSETDSAKPVFQGNIYKIERATQAGKITVTAYDNLFILTKSKSTRKFTNMTAEDIASAVCAEMGIKTGILAKTGVKMTFVAADKTGYQMIMIAYTQASKKNKKKYHPVMNVDKLDVIEKGTLIGDFEANQFVNEEDSTYSESIENMINTVKVTDEQGNLKSYERNAEWVSKYSMIMATYKSNPNRNAQEEVKALMKGPERTGTIDLLGDYRVVSSYSIKIIDMIAQLTGQFYVKSDTHTFENGQHTMRLEIEFENTMNEEKGGDDDGRRK